MRRWSHGSRASARPRRREHGTPNAPRSAGFAHRLLLATVAAPLLHACLFGGSLSVFVDDVVGFASISAGDVAAGSCFALEPGGTINCDINGITSGIDTLTILELIFVLVVLDPIVVQVPEELTNFQGSFSHTESGTGGGLEIVEGLGSVAIDVNRSFTAEPGTQLVTVGLPPGTPLDGTFAFNLNFEFPPGTPEIEVKPILTGFVELTDGSRFYPPLLPCVHDMADAPAVTIPLSSAVDTLTLPPLTADMGCDGVTYDFVPRGMPEEALDAFTLYRGKGTKGAPKFAKLGPVDLADQFGQLPYEVRGPRALALAGEVNQRAVLDSDTHLVEFPVKLPRGSKFVRRRDLLVRNQCGDVRVEVTKPVGLLVPSATCTDEPPGTCPTPLPPPDAASHDVDHFLCYKARPQKKRSDGTRLPKLPKGMQVDVLDAFQTRRYDLKKLTRLCNPVAKSGAPVLLSGPQKGSPFPLTPAAIEQPDVHLACYRAKPARRTIPQSGCGATDPSDRGTKIQPPQERHTKRRGLRVSDQLGEFRIDSVREIELCLPSEKLVLAP